MKLPNVTEDSTSQAGWMFADLFLALTVIFLATVSFIPNSNQQKDSTQKNQGNSSNQTSSNFQNQEQLIIISNGFIGEYASKGVMRFKSDLLDYLEQRNLPEETTALYLEAVGHTSAFGQANDAGNLAALGFVIDARKELPVILENSNTSISLSPDVEPGSVRIKITFT